MYGRWHRLRLQMAVMWHLWKLTRTAGDLYKKMPFSTHAHYGSGKRSWMGCTLAAARLEAQKVQLVTIMMGSALKG